MAYIEITFDFLFDRLVWLDVLPESERGTSRRIREDVEPLCLRSGIAFHYHFIKNGDEFRQAMDLETMRGRSPIIQIDGHGDQKSGLAIGEKQEYISFPELIKLLRKINVGSANNLLVVASHCFGLWATLEGELEKPTPYFAYFAPENIVTNGELEFGIPRFYTKLLESGRLEYALTELPSFKLFQCQELLLKVLIRRQAQLKGKRLNLLVEETLTQLKATGKILLNEPVNEHRKNIKSQLRKSLNQDYLDRLSRIHLLGRNLGFSAQDIQDLVSEILSNQPQNLRRHNIPVIERAAQD